MEDVENIVNTLHTYGLIDPVRVIGDWYQVRCPIHNGGQEKKPSCGILLHDQYKGGTVQKAGFVHCFSGETEVITDQGIKQMRNICGVPVQIINGNGDWESVVFRDYGIDQLWKLTLSRNQQTKVVYATKDHEWFVESQTSTCVTEFLEPGMLLSSLAVNCGKFHWKVESVEPTSVYDHVYCCETSTESFVLAGNILTHNCFSCGWAKPLSDTITEILRLRNISKSGLDWLKENVPGFDADAADFDYLIPQELTTTLQNSYALDYLNTLANKPSQTYVSEKELASYRLTVPYMYKRGLTDEIIDKYDIGYDANFIPEGRKKPLPCVTFPVKDRDGNTLFLCRRSIEGKFFHYPKSVEKSLYGQYELPPNCKSVLVCESCFNALTAVKYGYPAVALLGTGTAYEINQLKELGVQEFVLCLDGDEAGQRGMQKLKKALANIALVWVITMPPDKDVNDCTKEEFDALYASRE